MKNKHSPTTKMDLEVYLIELRISLIKWILWAGFIAVVALVGILKYIH